MKELITLPFTGMGRRRLWMGARKHVWPVSFPLASLYRRTVIRRVPVIAVVGSFGKTTTARAVAAAFGQDPCRFDWGLNSRGFLAEALLRARPTHDAVILEVGISRPGKMRQYAKLLKPDIAIVTSIGTEHHVTLGPISKISHEKSEMLRWLPPTGTAILNGDDPNVLSMAQQTEAAKLTFGFSDDCNIQASEYRLDGASGATFRLRVANEARRQRTRLIGRHQVYAILAAVAAAHASGRDLDSVCQSLETLSSTPRRLFPLSLQTGAVLLADDYKTVLETVDTALETLDAFPAQKRILVLGQICEPPGDADVVYAEVGRQAALVADHIVFGGPIQAFESLAKGAAKERKSVAYAGLDIHEAACLAGSEMTSKSVVLLKGFGRQRFERIALLLSGEAVTCSRPTCSASLTWPCATCPHLNKSRPDPKR